MFARTGLEIVVRRAKRTPLISSVARTNLLAAMDIAARAARNVNSFPCRKCRARVFTGSILPLVLVDSRQSLSHSSDQGGSFAMLIKPACAVLLVGIIVFCPIGSLINAQEVAPLSVRRGGLGGSNPG